MHGLIVVELSANEELGETTPDGEKVGMPAPANRSVVSECQPCSSVSL